MLKKNKMMKMYKKGNNCCNNINTSCNTSYNVQSMGSGKDSNVMFHEGMSGPDIEGLQKMLVEIVNLYPSLPILTIDGVYGMSTVNAVKEFQKLNLLPQTGSVNKQTLDKIRSIHLSNKEKFKEEMLMQSINEDSIKRVNDVKKNGENYLDQSENMLQEGSAGEYVKALQSYLNVVSNKYPTINLLRVDGIFGPKTKLAVLEFQRIFSLTQDGIVGDETWNKLSTVTGGNPISVGE